MRHVRKFPQIVMALAAAGCAALIAILMTTQLSFLKNLENAAADIRIAALQPPMPQVTDIVIAAITEDTLKQFPYRSPVDRAFLAGLVTTLQDKGARAIGIDVLFDTPTEEDKDKLLHSRLLDLKTPVFVSYTTSPSVVDEEQLAYLNEFVPADKRAAANLATDPFDGSVRWIFPGETEPGMPPSFPRRAAALAGVQTSAGWTQIAWRPNTVDGASPFPVYPAHAVAVMPKEWFEGKIVLIGAVLSITDRHRTPLAIVDDGDRGLMPGVLVQAHAISQLLEKREPQAVTLEKTVLMSVLLALVGAALGLMRRGVLFSVTAGALIMVALWFALMLGFRAGLPMLPLVAPTLALALSLGLMDMLIGRAERQQRQFIQGAFSRYVSPAVVSQLAEDPESLVVRGHRQEVTFIFTDVAGFTTMAEDLPSEVLSDVLNNYLEGACEIVFRHAGTIDKFIGDAIMVAFNAPVSQPDHVERAVRCAIELDDYCEQFRARQIAAGIPFGVTRIGIHTGPATVGNFGSHARMDFTALGDTVNTAARTEGVNKYFGTRICCTQAVVSACGERMDFLPIGDVVLKGRQAATTLYTPVSPQQKASDFARAYLDIYRLLASQSDQASEAVRQLAQTHPNEALAQFHAARAAKGINDNRIVMDDK